MPNWHPLSPKGGSFATRRLGPKICTLLSPPLLCGRPPARAEGDQFVKLVFISPGHCRLRKRKTTQNKQRSPRRPNHRAKADNEYCGEADSQATVEIKHEKDCTKCPQSNRHSSLHTGSRPQQARQGGPVLTARHFHEKKKVPNCSCEIRKSGRQRRN